MKCVFNFYEASAVADVNGTPVRITANPTLEIDIDSLYGGYLRFGNFVTDSFYPYAVVGYTKLKATSTSKRASYLDAAGNDTGVSVP